MLHDSNDFETITHEFDTFDEAVASADRNLMRNLRFIQTTEGYSEISVKRFCNPELETYDAFLSFVDPDGDAVSYSELVV